MKLVDRFRSTFRMGRPVERDAVNIHAVLEHVKTLASTGFGRHIRFVNSI